jgi:TolA-binding protein
MEPVVHFSDDFLFRAFIYLILSAAQEHAVFELRLQHLKNARQDEQRHASRNCPLMPRMELTGMSADAALADMIPMPSQCLACGADGSREHGVCARCGLTDVDSRALLRSAADAYESARDEASRGRYTAARRSLAAAGALGLADHPAVERLLSLSISASAPVSGAESTAYEFARSAAADGRFSDALRIGKPETRESPFLGELRRLSRDGARQKAELRLRGAVIGVTASLLFAGLAWKAFAPPAPSIAAQPVPSPTPVAAPSTPVLPIPTASPTPAVDPADVIEVVTYPYPERLARRLYNDALDARRDGDYRNAGRLADEAAIAGNHTYIAANALLLRAEIADTIRERDSAARWAMIAASAPDSPYAPLGLLRAAMRAQKLSGDRDARPYLMELFHRYGTSKEAAIARTRFGTLPE